MSRSRFAVIGVTIATAVAVSVSLAPAASAGAPSPESFASARPAYYLSLGDSLAFGYSQANQNEFVADNFKVSDFSGYTEILASQLGVAATNYSCPEETTSTMINGGCQGVADALALGLPSASLLQHSPYSGPQLGAATAFLSHHRWQRGVITLSIGADDILPLAAGCLGATSCPGLAPALKALRANLSTILSRLRRAAPFATVVVLTPYNPFGFADPASDLLAVQVDLSIAAVAVLHFDRVADSFVPLNVTLAAEHCTYVYFGCSAYPQDIHPTPAGYSVIAGAFEKALR